MFESDDFDQILSQFELPETPAVTTETVVDSRSTKQHTKPTNTAFAVKQEAEIKNDQVLCKSAEIIHETKASPKHNHQVLEKVNENNVSPKHTKRKLINSYFNHTSKRKFPGPAGLLNGSFKENEDESVCLQELLSQDFEYSQNCIPKDAFDSPLWKRLLEDVKSCKPGPIDTIVGIKQQKTTSDMRWRKAGTVMAFVEAVDRSNIDPLITLRDITDNIKCTLHRDVWTKFSSYLVPEYCALVLSKPTVLTMGTQAIKNHYLNITMSNILAIYSSAVLEDDNKEALDGCEIMNEEDFTIIKLDNCSADKSVIESSNPEALGLLDGLDSIFSDDIF